jgi:coenzyme Q-binding protein COQ10
MKMMVCRFHRNLLNLGADAARGRIGEIPTTSVRPLFGFPFKPGFPGSGGTSESRRKKYSERRLLGWSQEQLYEIVAQVEDYHKFLPACHRSDVLKTGKGFIEAELEIGIPPIITERYTSHVTLMRPTRVTAHCFDARLFKHLDTRWEFFEGLPNNPQTCTLDFHLDFEFMSQLHSQLANVFFDQLVHKTVDAFCRRARELYGRPQFIPSLR